MTTTPSLVRQEMIAIGPTELGQLLETPASIAVGSATFTSLATGGVLAERFLDKWLVRPDAASAADRVRRITDFNSATGALAHTATNYADTTVTGEACEVLGFEPRYFDEASNWALDRAKRLDVTELLALAGGGRHWLSALTWIKQPSDVKRIAHLKSPQLSKNRYFQKRNSYSSGALVPDDWTLSGAGATQSWVTSPTWRNAPYALQVTPGGGAAALLTQTVGLAETGVTNDSLRSYTVTVFGRARCTDASNARVWLSEDGGTTKQYSSYHTGGSTFEELSKEFDVTSAATNLTFGVEFAAGGAAAQAGECTLIYQDLGDAERRDVYHEEVIYERRYEQGAAGLPVELPSRGRGSCYHIYSLRGYPQIAASRLQAGSHDDDTIDAPVTLIATGAIARLYERLGQTDHADAGRWRALGIEWGARFQDLQKSHLYLPGTETPGVKLGPRYGYPARGRR